MLAQFIFNPFKIKQVWTRIGCLVHASLCIDKEIDNDIRC